MKCSIAQKRISDYLDGELTVEREKEIREHLEVCAKCRELFEDFQKIAQGARELSVLQPSPEVWSRIVFEGGKTEREALTKREKRWSWVPWLWPWPALRYATIGLLAGAIAGGLVIGLKPWKGLFPPGQKSFEYTMAKLKEAERYYEKAIASLEEAVKAQGNDLNPSLADVFKRNLEAMDETIQACQQMVKKDPENVTIWTYLLTAYRDKVSFLEEFMNVGRTSGEKELSTTI